MVPPSCGAGLRRAKYHLHRFTPGGKIDLCGHATLVRAYMLLRFYIANANGVALSTLSGDLIVKRKTTC
uniref:PhzF family phenazine biosynthesis protein n=1 Tax=Collinsella bouchesdurhonensis TaxID=1907654 RepID=UPI00359C6425